MESIQPIINFVGFLKEHNDRIPNSRYLSDVIDNDISTIENKDKIIKYLAKGRVVISWMGYFIDDDKNLIAPDCYYTDGLHIWPSYLPYYVNLYPNYSLDKDFIIYLEKRNYKFPSLDEHRLNFIENNYSDILVGNPPPRES